MTYFSTESKPTYHMDKKYLPMAGAYWGQMPLPKDAELVGGYADKKESWGIDKNANRNLCLW